MGKGFDVFINVSKGVRMQNLGPSPLRVLNKNAVDHISIILCLTAHNVPVESYRYASSNVV